VSDHSRSSPAFGLVTVPGHHRPAWVSTDWRNQGSTTRPAVHDVHGAAQALLDALGPLFRTGRLKGPTATAAARLEAALAGAGTTLSPGASGAEGGLPSLHAPRPAATETPRSGTSVRAGAGL
jgi:hypothetical protein